MMHVMTPEESAAYNIRTFRRVRPGTIISICFNDYRNEVAICEEVVSDLKIRVAYINIDILQKLPEVQMLEFSEVYLINILKEKAVEVTASQDWTHVTITSSSPTTYKSLNSFGKPDDCFDALRNEYQELDQQIRSFNTSTGPGKLFQLTLWAEIEEVEDFFLQRGWKTFDINRPPTFGF